MRGFAVAIFFAALMTGCWITAGWLADAGRHDYLSEAFGILGVVWLFVAIGGIAIAFREEGQ